MKSVPQLDIPRNVLRAPRPFDVGDLEKDIVEVVSNHAAYAPPSTRLAATSPLPEYVAHADGVPETGRLSAEALVREYETAAAEIEAMGNELKDAAARCETMVADVHKAIAFMKETAAKYRSEGKVLFEKIEAVTTMTTEVRNTCEAMRNKISSST